MENMRTDSIPNDQRPTETHSQGMIEPSRSTPPALAPVGPASQSSTVHVQVGRMILDGFNLPSGGDRLVKVAFEQEMARLFAAEEIPTLLRSGGARRELPGGALSISAWQDPADLGRQIARALYEGMQR